MDFISAQFVMCCPCATPHTSFNINALAIMQGFQNSEQNYNIKGWQLAILDFIYAKNALCCPCVYTGRFNLYYGLKSSRVCFPR